MGKILAVVGVLVVGWAIPANSWSGTLDEGLLDPTWFNVKGEFRQLDEVDYLWVKPGFSLQGRTLHVEDWDDPVLLAKKKRDAKDAAKAEELTATFPSRVKGALTHALDGVATVSRKEGDLVLTGRIVDCNAGSRAAKIWIGMGAGASSATWDIKLVDRQSGDTLLALHHRAISGTEMSTIDDKIIKWLEKLGELLRQGAWEVYQQGKGANR